MDPSQIFLAQNWDKILLELQSNCFTSFRMCMWIAETNSEILINWSQFCNFSVHIWQVKVVMVSCAITSDFIYKISTPPFMMILTIFLISNSGNFVCDTAKRVRNRQISAVLRLLSVARLSFSWHVKKRCKWISLTIYMKEKPATQDNIAAKGSTLP